MNRLTAIDAIGAAAGIVKLAIGADARAVKDRGDKILGGVGFCLRESAMFIGASDDTAGLDAATGEETGKHIAPVTATRSEHLAGRILSTLRNGRNPWRASHFAAHHDQRFVEQPAVGQVIQKAAQSMIE